MDNNLIRESTIEDLKLLQSKEEKDTYKLLDKPVYRGIHASSQILDYYQPGVVGSWNSFSSFNKNKVVACEYA